MARLHTSQQYDSPHVPGWLPDETLFSLCSREHLLSGARLSNMTTQRLFGDCRRGAHHDLPTRLAHFIEATDGKFGKSALQICRERTLWGFYFPWRTGNDSNRLLTLVSGQSSESPKVVLGIRSSHFGNRHPLRMCPRCMKVDRETYGTAYWHLDHQLPAVRICSIHRCLLLECQFKGQGSGQFLWALPKQDQVIPMRNPVRDRWALWTQFGQLVLDATHQLNASYIDYARLRQVYADALNGLGLTKRRGLFCIPEIARLYLDFFDELRVLHEFEYLPVSTASCVNHLSKILYPSRLNKHPLMHLLFIGWLFGSWHLFWSDYTSCRDKS